MGAAKIDKMNARQKRFCEEYIVDLNGKQASIRAGYSAKTAEVTGSQLLRNPKVSAYITALQLKRSNRVEITADEVLEQLWNIATADPRELTENRRGACRYCYGDNFRYQMTPSEMEEAIRVHDEREERRLEGKKGKPKPFDTLGGYGFDPHKEPNPECPECFGDGIPRPFVADTRKISKKATSLLAAVKETKDGIEIKKHDKMKALELIGKHLGMFPAAGKFELVGKDGKDLIPDPKESIVVTGEKAMEVYLKLMQGDTEKP
ncbi:MAG: terminase small subunit [Desulfobulbaceae bacterium]|nr:terminase small subunit [Desulfobulbaceae bacterium]